MPNPHYGLGIDVGDQTVVAAVCWTAGTQSVVEPVPLAGHAMAVPAAIELDGAGRPSLARPDGAVGPDPAAAGHLLTRIGGPTPVYVGGSPVGAADAVAAMVAGVLTTVAERQGGPAARTVVTVPPSWGEHRRAHLTAALQSIGSPGLSLASSAVATVRHHAGDDTLPPQATLAVYDVGGSTVDTAVVRTTRTGPAEQLGRPPAPLTWGGRDVDDAVLDLVCSRLGIRTTSKGLAADTRVRLVALRRACVTAKETLSSESDVHLDVDLAATGRDTAVRLARADVDPLVRTPVEASVDVLRQAVTDAGLTVEDLDGVLLAGGGAAMPLVRETLAAELGRPVIVDSRPAWSAALGAARLAWDLVPEHDDGPIAAHPSPPGAGRPGRARATPRRPAPVRSPRHSGASPAPRPPVPATRRRTQRIGIVATAFVGLSLVFGTLLAVDSGTRSALEQTVLNAHGQVPQLDQPSFVQPVDQNTDAASQPVAVVGRTSSRNATPGAGAARGIGTAAPGQREALVNGTTGPAAGSSGATTGPAGATGTTGPAGNPTSAPAGGAGPAPAGSPQPDPTTPSADASVPPPTLEPSPQPTPEPTPGPTVEPTPQPTPDPTPEPTPDPTPDPTVEPSPPTLEPAPELSPSAGASSDTPTGAGDPAPVG